MMISVSKTKQLLLPGGSNPRQLPSDLLQSLDSLFHFAAIINKLRLQLTVEQLSIHEPLMPAFLSMCLCICPFFIPSLTLKGPVGVRPKRCAKARIEIEKVMMYLGDIVRSCLKTEN